MELTHFGSEASILKYYKKNRKYSKKALLTENGQTYSRSYFSLQIEFEFWKKVSRFLSCVTIMSHYCHHLGFICQE